MKSKTLIGTLLATTLLGAAIFAVPVIAENHGQGQMGKNDNRPAFAELDTDGDGNVTIAEAKAHQAAKFAENDTNGDGVLSAEELVASHTAKMMEMMSSRVERMIEWRDANGDGALSQDELSGGMGERMFGHLDSDGDGMISESEFDQAGMRGKGGKHGRRGGGHGGGHGNEGGHRGGFGHGHNDG